MRIFLIGFMKCGKSTLGKKLAYEIKMDFIDLDESIIKIKGKTIDEIFRMEGENAFRKQEAKCLQEASCKENVVVAAGGGAPCYHDNMNLIKKNGISFYLKLPEMVLWERIKKIKQNLPLVAGLNDDELKNYIMEKLKEREPYYLQANYIFDIENQAEEQIIEQFLANKHIKI